MAKKAGKQGANGDGPDGKLEDEIDALFRLSLAEFTSERNTLAARLKKEGRANDLPVNHSPHFAPVLHPTLETGVEALVAAALAWLGAR